MLSGTDKDRDGSGKGYGRVMSSWNSGGRDAASPPATAMPPPPSVPPPPAPAARGKQPPRSGLYGSGEPLLSESDRDRERDRAFLDPAIADFSLHSAAATAAAAASIAEGLGVGPGFGSGGHHPLVVGPWGHSSPHSAFFNDAVAPGDAADLNMPGLSRHGLPPDRSGGAGRVPIGQPPIGPGGIGARPRGMAANLIPNQEFIPINTESPSLDRMPHFGESPFASSLFSSPFAMFGPVTFHGGEGAGTSLLADLYADSQPIEHAPGRHKKDSSA